MHQTDVLIAGAGPTGLVLALWLTRLGSKVRIVDKTAEPGTASRALVIHARTLELYRQLDLTDEVLDRSLRVPGINLWVRGERESRIPFDEITDDLSPYGPNIFPQDQHERLLIARLEKLGISVERRTELLSFRQEEDRIVAELRGPDGQSETCEALYLAGCDGASSTVRHVIGAGFPGGTYQQVFYVADVEASGPAANDEINLDLDDADFLALFPMKGEGRARLIGTVRDERAKHADKLKFEDVSDSAIHNMKVDIRQVNWFSTYRVHHRVTNTFRDRRAFLVGDAAHIHSPAGGQGMNTGIGDAINLAWKIHAVIAGKADSKLLDTYELERMPFARRLVATTDRAFTMATAEGPIADLVRTRLVPLVLPTLFKFEAFRDYMLSTVSQLTIAYRDSPVSDGAAGGVHAGDRLPWARTPDADNFDSLTAPQWQVHVYGNVSPAISAWCDDRHLPLHRYAWQEEHAVADFAEGALYLIRPDAYIGFADAAPTPAALENYLASQKIAF